MVVTLERESSRNPERVGRMSETCMCDTGERRHAEEDKMSERLTASGAEIDAFVRCRLVKFHDCRMQQAGELTKSRNEY